MFCDVYDVYKNQPYEKCPRSIAKKALQHLKDSGLGDVAYFGAENEFLSLIPLKLKTLPIPNTMKWIAKRANGIGIEVLKMA